MTDRLSTLLHDEVAGLPVPTPPADRVLAEGRTIRGRRRARTAVTAAVAAVAVVAAGIAITTSGSDGELEPAKQIDQEAYQQLGAWARGDEVHVGNHTATVPGVETLMYSTAGVVVTTQEGYVLVTPEGEVEPLDLSLLDSSLEPPDVATDPTTSKLAYVRAVSGGRAQTVVRDLATSDETPVGEPFRTDVPDGVDWISGDLLQSSRRGEGRILDWQTGKTSPIPSQGWWKGSGVSIDYHEDTWILRSFDGKTLLTAPSADPATSYGTLSPDGRYFAVPGSDGQIAVHEIATGETTVIEDRSVSGYGWTPDGHLVGKPAVARSEVEVCDPATGTCEGTGVEAGELTVVPGTPGAGGF